MNVSTGSTMNNSYGRYGEYGVAADDPRPWYSIPLIEYAVGDTRTTAAQQAQYRPPDPSYYHERTFIDTNRDYAYYAFQSRDPKLPVYFQIVQGPPGTTLGKYVKIDSGGAWSAIRAQYQRLASKVPSKQILPMRYVNTGEAGTTQSASSTPPGYSTPPSSPYGPLTSTGLVPGASSAGGTVGPGIGTILAVGGTVTLAVLAAAWAFGGKK